MKIHPFLTVVFSSVVSLMQAQSLDPAARLLVNQSAIHAPQREAGRTADEQVSVYVRYDASDTDWQAIARLGGKVGVMANGWATVRLPLSRVSDLGEVSGISYVQASGEARLMLDLARAEALANEAQLLTNPVDPQSPFLGKGVVIGQVDAGLDYTHRAFHTADGELRIKRVWEQGTDPATAPIAGLHSPKAFGYGAEFDTAELIQQAGGDTNAGSHGTHVMGIAAGSDTYLDGQFRGIAPEAELVMVAITDVGADNVRISDAIKYIFDYADQVDKPCVINLSLGSHQGPHDGTSPFDQIADALQGPGRLIVGSAGNYGADKFHLNRYFGGNGSAITSFQTILNHEFYSSYRYGDVELWADDSLNFSLELFDYSVTGKSESENTVLTLAEMLDGQVHEVSLGRNVTGTVQLTGEKNPLNGKTHVLLRSYITNLRARHLLGLRLTALDDTEGQMDLWADDNKIHFDYELDGFDITTTESTITEIGGTANSILSVGAYTTRDQFQLEGSDTWYPVGMQLGVLCTFSGFGPTADGRQKPEVCAPGSFIVSSVSGYDVTGPYLHSHYTDETGHPQRYGYLQGTSMSAPFVTGTVALLLQANPLLTPDELKQIIYQTSRSDEYCVDTNQWGAGKVDVRAALQYCLEHNDNAITQPTAVRPASVYNMVGQVMNGASQRGFFIVNDGTSVHKIHVR